MKYDLNKLNPYDFEGLIQSLSKRILGSGVISFGEGTDGGREAEFTGNAPFPSETLNWTGYWVVQAKFKSISNPDESKDFKWIQDQLKGELEKYGTRKIKVRKPDNYLMFTNVVLTARPGTGGRDRATQLEKEYQMTYGIKNIRILSYDDIINFLDANRDLATAYSPFILPGDVLSKLLTLVDVQSMRALRTREILIRFLEYEFSEDTQAKLDHAGKLTSDKVNLENVFIDLYATVDGQFKEDRGDKKFVDSIIQKGNSIIKGKGSDSKARYVLIAGPGYGKSTLTQFVIQTHRAFFINDSDKHIGVSESIISFIKSYATSKEVGPQWIRLPIKIILKEFAGWIRERSMEQGKDGTSLLEYIVFNINRKSSGGDMTTKELEDLLHNLPSIFVFDGLDEVPPSSNRSIVLSELSFFSETILRRIDADAIIIATTRPQGYTKEFDNSKFQHLYISDLQKVDCVTYLQRLLAKLIDDLDERNQKFQVISEGLNNIEISRLMKSPLQASIMAILVKSGGNPPRDKFDLFTNYYEIIFKREKQRGISTVLNERPEYVHEIHNRLGLLLQTVSEQSANPSATISREDFIKMVSDYLNEIALDKDDIVRLTNGIVTAATDRLVFISEVQEEKFGFAIRSLQEYFAAHGYLHNARDQAIRNHFYAICKSSYWSNTLLFAVGYIAKNKPYLTDYIESICHELNGSTDQKNEKSVTSIVKIGSWIALDIVNEGIYSGKPIIENKFCNLLEPLFYIAWNDKHKEISKLPTKIIEKWIKPFLAGIIKNTPTNSTALTICIQLEKAGYNTMEVIFEHWPVDRVTEAIFINNFATTGLNSEYIVEKFIGRLERGEIDSFIYLIENENGYEFLRSVCESHHNTQRSKSVLFELLFIRSLSEFGLSTTNDLLRKLGADLPDKLSRGIGDILRNSSDKISVVLVDGYSYEILKGKIQNNIIMGLRQYADENSISLVSAICKFLEHTTIEEFEQLNNQIDSRSETFKNFVLLHLRPINSFLGIVYMENELPANWRHILQTIQTAYLPTLDLEQQFELRKYAMVSSLSPGNYLKRLDEFERLYLINQDPIPKAAYSVFYKLFEWSFTKMSKDEIEKLKQKDRFDLVRKTIFEHAKNESFYFRNLSSLFYFLTVSEVSIIIQSSPSISSFTLRILSENEAGYNYDSHLFNLTLPKVMDLITLQFMQGQQPSFKILLQQIVVGLILGYHIDLDPFKTLLSGKSINTNKNERYRAAIMLVQKTFDKSDYELFTQILSTDSGAFHDRSFMEVLMYTLKFSAKTKILEKIFTFLEGELVDEWDQRELQNQIKNYIGNQKSGVELGALNELYL